MADTQAPSETARIYAIGDIHGRLDLLDRAIAAIERDVKERGPAALTVTLGEGQPHQHWHPRFRHRAINLRGAG